ncbi:hypothetical protein LOD99_14630 [Oopsacas minuta]|uniref:Uncharacterized protein n=1 Tax=Oopsacas minuta TaxID=111878 RepID=A0AAV7KFP1_9METZ|nr:hypothetical protein LOD99_14630 [Oopsacas minuta]
MSDFVRKANFAYFQVKLGDQDKLWIPHIVCKTCNEYLRLWTNSKRKSFKFGVTMVWREQRNHYDNCYFCMVDMKGFNRHKKRMGSYPDSDSDRCPVLHSEEIPLPKFSQAKREEGLIHDFSQQEDLVFYNVIGGLLPEMGVPQYRPEDWSLFNDSSKRSLKCVLLHNGNKYASVSIVHSTKLKEEYENIKMLLQKLKYHEHQWLICVDLKMANLLLGQQSGYTKYPCFVCLCDSRARKDH